MTSFRVAERPRFKVSEVDLPAVLGYMHGGEMAAEDGDDMLTEAGEIMLLEDPAVKSFFFSVEQRPIFRVD